MIRKFLKLSLLSIFISPILIAQELTSDITGSVSSANGAVSGAQVEITYEPTNTVVTRVTDASGRYSVGGLRPGGPYTIKVSAAGLAADQVTTSLVVGETSRLSFVLSSASSVDDVVVTAQRVSSDDGLGFSSTIDAQTIQETPSVTRDIKDLIKLNPLVSLDDAEDDYASISIGGAHPRSNDIKVDGVSFNDDFGLNDNGYPSQRSPINLDSIEQMSVKVAPASVEYSNFRGGIIEFVTKGGTNEFEGSVGYYDRGDQFYGDKIEGQKYTFDKEDTAQSFTLGGPIIKDKAFFYVTYEETTVTNPVLYGPAGSGAANEQAITLAQVDNIRQITINKYGWDPLGVASTTESNQENTSLRVDYILNENHRLTYNYKSTEGDRLRASGTRAFILSLLHTSKVKKPIHLVFF
jgi:outer membrane receptor for ferrienterochelin and colicin